jgi:hypothetical protein
MKNTLLTFVFFVDLFGTCFAQNFNWTSPNYYTQFRINCVKPDDNNIFANSVSVVDKGNFYYFTSQLLKYDYNGNIIFNKFIGDSNLYMFPNYKSSFDKGEYALCMEFRSAINPNYIWNQGAFFIDSSLTKSFYYEGTYDSLLRKFIMSAKKIDSNKYAIAWSAQSIENNATSSLLLRIIDSTKNILLEKTITNVNYWLDCLDLFSNENGLYLIVSKRYINNSTDPTDLVIYHLDTLGNILNTYQTNDHKWYATVASATLPNGDFFVGGFHAPGIIPGINSGVYQKKYIARFDKNLNLIWRKTFARKDGFSAVYKLFIASDSTLMGCGNDGFPTFNGTDSVGHGTGCIFKFSLDGDSIWQRNYQAIDNFNGEASELYDFCELPNGNGYVAGGSVDYAWPVGGPRGWLIKVGIDGCLTEECLNSAREVENKEEFFVYPNPTNDILNITNPHQISTYQIYQLDGKLITQDNNFPIYISKFTNGVYFLKITTKNNQIINRKIIKQ